MTVPAAYVGGAPIGPTCARKLGLEPVQQPRQLALSYSAKVRKPAKSKRKGKRVHVAREPETMDLFEDDGK